MNFSVKRYIFSFLLSFVISMAIIAVFSIIFHFLSPPDWLSTGLVRYFCYFAVCPAAFFSAFGTERNGMLKGIISADIYMLILILLGMVFLKNSFPVNSLLKIFGISSFLGGIFGIAGINIKK